MRTGEEQRIETAVKLLAACHNRPLPQPAVDRWIRKLAPFAQKSALYRALEEACDRPKMPACSEVVSDVLEEISRENARAGLNASGWNGPRPPPLTQEQQARADHSAVMSTLWLIYEKGWSVDDITRKLGTLFGADPRESITAAMQKHTPDSVRWWMQHQIENGR